MKTIFFLSFYISISLQISSISSQELQLYYGNDEVYTMTEKMAEIGTNVAELISKTERICWTGMWVFYESANYTSTIYSFINYREGEVCEDIKDPSVLYTGSVRYLGNPSIVGQKAAIYLYEDEWFRGQETEATWTSASVPVTRRLKTGSVYFSRLMTTQQFQIGVGDSAGWCYELSQGSHLVSVFDLDTDVYFDLEMYPECKWDFNGTSVSLSGWKYHYIGNVTYY